MTEFHGVTESENNEETRIYNFADTMRRLLALPDYTARYFHFSTSDTHNNSTEPQDRNEQQSHVRWKIQKLQ